MKEVNMTMDLILPIVGTIILIVLKILFNWGWWVVGIPSLLVFGICLFMYAQYIFGFTDRVSIHFTFLGKS